MGDHKGWRIVVDGAGPNGGPLVTDIQNVGEVADGKQVLILADPASTEVTNAAAVANDGTRAKLSDHARVSVGPLQITIGNRQVADAAMTVGSNLRSDEARFSALDVGALAGHHLTIVQEVPDAATFNVTAQFFIVNLVLSNLSSAFCSNSNSNSRKCICVVRACSSGLLAILLELWPLTRANLGQICDLSLAGS